MPEPVAVLGTGIMGAAMSRRLLAAGSDVRVWNRTREKAEAVPGGHVAADPAEAVRDAAFALTMLADGDAVLAVAGRMLPAMVPAGIWIQASTIGIDATEACARLSDGYGIAFVDAPVLGTRAPAERGELTVLASGPNDALERCSAVFDAIGSKTLRLGEAGQGARVKLVINSWLLGLVAALAETVTLADALGLDPNVFLDLIEGGSLAATYARMKGDMMLRAEYPVSFPLALAGKDARLVLDAARRHGAEPSVMRAIADLFARADSLGFGDRDMAAVREALRRR